MLPALAVTAVLAAGGFPPPRMLGPAATYGKNL
jgi:hypothetical protein